MTFTEDPWYDFRCPHGRPSVTFSPRGFDFLLEHQTDMGVSSLRNLGIKSIQSHWERSAIPRKYPSLTLFLGCRSQTWMSNSMKF